MSGLYMSEHWLLHETLITLPNRQVSYHIWPTQQKHLSRKTAQTQSQWNWLTSVQQQTRCCFTPEKHTVVISQL